MSALDANLRSLTRSVFRAVGLDVRLLRNLERNRRAVARDEWKRAWSGFGSADIRTVLDIGANTGQFAEMISGICPNAKLICFEPLATCYQELVRTISRIPRAEAWQIALGDASGEVVMYRSDFSPSSSMLEMHPGHMAEWPESAGNRPELIRVERLDDVAGTLELVPDILVKIDVQGFERHVISGGERTLQSARWVVLEVAFREYYRGQASFHDVYTMMTALGFTYQGSLEQHRSRSDGAIVLADALFVRQ